MCQRHEPRSRQRSTYPSTTAFALFLAQLVLAAVAANGAVVGELDDMQRWPGSQRSVIHFRAGIGAACGRRSIIGLERKLPRLFPSQHTHETVLVVGLRAKAAPQKWCRGLRVQAEGTRRTRMVRAYKIRGQPLICCNVATIAVVAIEMPPGFVNGHFKRCFTPMTSLEGARRLVYAVRVVEFAYISEQASHRVSVAAIDAACTPITYRTTRSSRRHPRHLLRLRHSPNTGGDLQNNRRTSTHPEARRRWQRLSTTKHDTQVHAPAWEVGRRREWVSRRTFTWNARLQSPSQQTKLPPSWQTLQKLSL